MMVKILGGIFIVVLSLILWMVFLYQSYSRRLPKPPFQKRELVPNWNNWGRGKVVITWIGHSTVLMQIQDVYILTDPVFAKRVGIRIGWFKVGPRRFSEPALYPSELPQIDFVLLSHAHLDHLDLQSLHKVVTDKTVIITAENTGKVLKRIHAKRIVELASGKKIAFENGLRIHSVDVKHWGNRFPWNKNYGWTGFLIEYGQTHIFFAGDTAYVDSFSRLEKEFGQIDVACIPIGAYKPDSFQRAHCSPEQAWSMFLDSGANWMIPIHWNTFVLSQEPVDEPMQRLIACADGQLNRIVIRKQGETFELIR